MNEHDVEINLTDEDFCILAKEAHKQDITFNELVNNILREEMKNKNLASPENHL